MAASPSDFDPLNDPSTAADAATAERRRQTALMLANALRGQQPQGAGMDVTPQGLARQRAVGLLALLTGNRQLSGAGDALVSNANQQETFQRQTPGIDLANRQRQQEVEASDRQTAAMQNPATAAAYRQTLHSYGTDVDEGTPASVMQGMIPVAEKGYAARESAQSRRDAAKLRAGDPNSAEAIAQAIIDGDQPPDLSRMYGMAPKVRGVLAQKGFNLSAAMQEWMTQKHLATMNGPQQERLAQAVDFTSHSLDNIEQLYGDWKKAGVASGIRIFNRAALGAAKQLPGDAGATAQALEGQINDLTAELSNVYMGGNSPTDHAIKLAQQNLGADWNEEQFKKAINQIRTNLQMRQNAMQNAQTRGVGGSRYDQAAPVAAPAQQGGPKKIASDDEYDALPSGTDFIGPDGVKRRKP